MICKTWYAYSMYIIHYITLPQCLWKRTLKGRFMLPNKDGGRKKSTLQGSFCLYFIVKSIRSYISSDTSKWVMFKTLLTNRLPRQLAEFFQLTCSWLTAASLRYSLDELSSPLYTSLWLKQYHHCQIVTFLSNLKKNLPKLNPSLDCDYLREVK